MKTFLATLLVLVGFSGKAQVKAGDNPNTIGKSSILELESTNKGLVITRVVNTSTVTTPVNGMLVYDISSHCIKSYENGTWSGCWSNGSNIEPSTNGSAIVTSYTPTTAAGVLNTGVAAVGVSQMVIAQVSQPGTYNILTVNNGVVFTASGVFTGIGPQPVVLMAMGSPGLSGSYSYVLNTVPSAAFSRDVIDLSSGGTATVASYTCTTASEGVLNVGVPVSGVRQAITANATHPGTYNITTTTSNGVTFSGSGTLTAGTNTIMLTATGTPTSAVTGTYTLFSYPGAAPNCSFSRTAIQPTSGGTAVISGYACTTSSAGTMTQGVAVSGVTQTITATVTTPGTYNITAVANGVTFSRSGTFSGNGAQTVVLNATGTPNAGGAGVPFAISAVPGCTFNRDIISTTSNGTAVVSGYSCDTASAGTLYTNTPPSAVTQTITAQVTTAGTYAISATSNGIVFSRSGTFTGTGPQTIVLNATGTSATAGDKSFTINTTPGCSFTRSVSLSPTSNGTALVASYNCNTASGGALIVNASASGTVTQTITAQVTTAGTYSIATNTADGVTFTAAGTFTGAGAQTILLQAAGTPSTAATGLNFTLNTTPNCSFSRTVGNISSGGTAMISDFTCNTSSAGTLTQGSAAVNVTQTITATVTTPGTYSITTDTVNGIRFSGSGTFTGTGPQAIQLNATGTPISLQSPTFTLTTTPNCSFTRTIYSPSSNGTAVVTSYNCSTASLGTMTKGVAIPPNSVTQTITAAVATPGTYNISIPAVNGISWTASGTFSGTAAQTIILTASGTPTVEGTHTFSLPVSPGCNFTRSVGDVFTNNPLCTSAYGSYPTTVTVGSSTVSVTKTGTDGGSGTNSSQCSISISGSHVILNNTQSVTYSFGVPLRNVQVFGLYNQSNEGNEGYKVEAFYESTPVAVQLVNFGTGCEPRFETSQSGVSASIINNLSTISSGTIFNISSATAYNKITITRIGSNGSSNGHSLLFCNATAVPNVSSGGSAVIATYSSCNNYEIEGNLYINTPASDAAIPVVQGMIVNVNTLGTYSISTNTVAGVYFYGSGTFTATGIQSIRLRAFGTPTSTGSKTFTLSTSPGCSFNRTVDNSPTSGGTAVISAITACSSSTAGTMTRDNPIAANSVTQTITVNVSAGGSYSISIPATNGISWTGTGTLTAGNGRTIALTASGTPTVLGANTFTLPATMINSIASVSCNNFTRTVNEAIVCSLMYAANSSTQQIPIGATTVGLSSGGGTVTNGSDLLALQCGVNTAIPSGYSSNPYPILDATNEYGIIYEFDKKVNNIMIYGYGNSGDEKEGYAVIAYSDLFEATAVPCELVVVGGNCTINFVYSTVTSQSPFSSGVNWDWKVLYNNTSNSTSSGIIFKVVVPSGYKRLRVKRYSKTNASGSNSHGLMFCNAVVVP